jgi:hypothetical protein
MSDDEEAGKVSNETELYFNSVKVTEKEFRTMPVSRRN